MSGMGHKSGTFCENFTSIRTKNLQTCVRGTHLSGKCRHCETVSSRSNVGCHPETAVTPISVRRCAQSTLYLCENKVSYYEGKRASQLLSSFLLQTANRSCECKKLYVYW